MDRADELTTVMEHALAASEVEVVEIAFVQGVLRVIVDRPGGVNLDVLTEVNQALSTILDERAELAPSGPYQLEVSSPGLERPLRTPAHFRRVVGSAIAVKTAPGTDGERRLKGTLSIADDSGIVMQCESGEVRRLAYSDISQARTTFAWGAETNGRTQPPRTQTRRSTGS